MVRDPVPLRGLTWAHPRGFDSLVACNDDLERDLGVTVDWEARSLLDFGDRPIHEFSHRFDLMIVDHPHIAAAVSEGSLVALDQHLLPVDLEVFRVESAGRSHESYSYQGHQWALAVDAAAQVTAVRPDLITDLPLRWSDALELAEQGRALWAHKPVDAFSTYATVCAQLGAPIDDYERFAPAVSDETLDLLRQIADACPEWCADANPIDVAEAMTATDDFSIGISMFGYSNYSRPGFRSRHLVYEDVTSFDGRPRGAILGGAGIAISSSSLRIEEAVQTAARLAGSSLQKGAYGLGGGQPANQRAWIDDDLNDASSQFFRRTARTIENAWVRPALVGWPRAQFTIGAEVHAAVRGVGTVDEATRRIGEALAAMS